MENGRREVWVGPTQKIALFGKIPLLLSAKHRTSTLIFWKMKNYCFLANQLNILGLATEVTSLQPFHDAFSSLGMSTTCGTGEQVSSRPPGGPTWPPAIGRWNR